MAAQDLVQTVCTVLCKTLTPSQAEEILAATQPRAVPAGHIVFREGEEGTGLLLLLKGSVEVIKQGPNGLTQQLATVDAPSVLGEMSLVSERRHSATVRATTDCEFRVLAREDFLRLLERDNLAAHKLIGAIAEVLARRLRRMNDMAMELLGRSDAPPPLEELARFKQKLFSEWSF
ncbi:MAG: cyclic nucleotide-binding domain-containing protein [Candidatus Rokubacteria bacterium]|nr:cyclic nucleotide-binding domain-containing protein [Candidatus Rokubacteria bacterium]